MSSLPAFLSSLGLDSQEPAVYMAALPLGTVPASILAARLKIPRSTARYTCEQLVRKGLMTMTTKRNTHLFTAEHPNKLFALVHEEQERLDRKTDQLADVVQAFQKLYSPFTALPKVTFFEGVDGIERMLDEFAKEKSNIYSYGAGDYVLRANPELVRRFRAKAKERQKDVSIIRSPKYRALHGGTDGPGFRTKYFRSLEELEVDVQIANETIAISSVDENAATGVLIKHPKIVRAFRQIFEELWAELDS